MTNEELTTGLRHIAQTMERNGHSYYQHVAENAIKALEQQPSEDCISREEVQDLISRWLSDYLLDETREALETINYKVGDMPSVTPERPNPDMIKRIRRKIDEMTEIHSDGEFYIKNVDAKWIISKYLCGAEMSGGEEDG